MTLEEAYPTYLKIMSPKGLIIKSTKTEPNPFYEMAKNLSRNEPGLEELPPSFIGIPSTGSTINIQGEQTKMKHNIITLDFNDNWNYPVPTGFFPMIDNIPFLIDPDDDGGASIISVSPTDDNEIVSHTIYPGITKDVDALCLLLNVKFGLRVVDGEEWEGKTIGSIKIRDLDDLTFETELVLGENVRDWCPNNHPNAVFALKDPNTYICWQSADGEFSFDYLKIPVPIRMDGIDSICISARLEVPGKAKKAKLYQAEAII